MGSRKHDTPFRHHGRTKSANRDCWSKSLACEGVPGVIGNGRPENAAGLKRPTNIPRESAHRANPTPRSRPPMRQRERKFGDRITPEPAPRAESGPSPRRSAQTSHARTKTQPTPGTGSGRNVNASVGRAVKTTDWTKNEAA